MEDDNIAVVPSLTGFKSPIILQVSQGGAAYFAGKGISNDGQHASIVGGVAAANFIRLIAPAYGIPVVVHSDHCASQLLPFLTTKPCF